ncbi:hypothetical protein C6A36_01230 [Desulfobacteraceae bacterium SEEP-SAG10]|nr:hypothetical protein C6A36_01230 [Desulfobacteraceae bacterium SEEP-SAG10]
MGNGLNDFSLRFQTKGFMPIEISGLVKDIFYILDKDLYRTRTEVNQELEDLGWGIGIMDNVSYELMNSMVQ